MLTLGIESSCDETALALVSDGRLLAQKLATQIDVHALFGGVVPEIASREHYRVLGPLYDALLEETGVATSDIEAVAVARGPGLLGSLLVGLGFAKGLAFSSGAKLVGVNHLHAHLLAPGLHSELVFPALGLLVSGGHTQIYRIESDTRFELLGRTLDDAAGEAFDKVAKMLNMPYPGGRYIDVLGGLEKPDKTRFPRPYLDNSNLDFSFSGLKTAVGVYIEANPGLRLPALADPEELLRTPEAHTGAGGLAETCASFNFAVADTLRVKLERAVKKIGPVKSLIAAGGVAANSRIRAMLDELAGRHRLELRLPEPWLCTDNAAMIAYTGERLAKAGLYHGPDLEAVPRGRKIPWDYES